MAIPAGAKLVGLCLILAALTFWVPEAPFYDAWSWIVWGREVVAGELSTTGTVSWKPLPVLFTAPFSLFGDLAPDLWLFTARALAIGAVAAAASIGVRLAGRLGGVLAGGLLLISPWFWESAMLGASEGGAILFVLGAVDRHLVRRPGQAFASGVAAALIRPEAAPFLGLYALWLISREPRRLRWIVPGIAALVALWLLPELWGSGELFRSATRAQQHIRSGPALAERPAVALVQSALSYTPAVVLLGLVGALGGIAARLVPSEARTPALAISLFGAAWLALVALMAEAGFSGNQRYLLVAVAIAHLLAGVGLAWAFTWLSRLPTGRVARVTMSAALAMVILFGALRVVALGWPPVLSVVVRHERVHDDLEPAIAKAGGRGALERCGRLFASNDLTPPVAWAFHRHLNQVISAPRFPGVVLRVRLREDQPLDPPRTTRGTNGTPEVRTRTPYWEVEASCGRDAQRRQR